MRPEICEFISSAVYENRLTPHPTTVNNAIVLGIKEIITKEHGLLFIPIDHDGNTQGSEEEASMIRQIVASLKGSRISEVGGKPHDFSLKDCLFVAPYNLQVGKLIKELGSDAKVGSVDLFQGQEAPIVFLSMCSSDGESSPRGLTFLLNKNRLNVAISRAKALAIVVGSSRLADTRATSIKAMRLLNLYCRILETSSEN